jgi:hypothetical protein
MVTTKILVTGKVQIFCSVPQILWDSWMIWGSHSIVNDGLGLLGCNSGQNLSGATEKHHENRNHIRIFQEEICAKVLHNNDAGMQNIRPYPSVSTFNLQDLLTRCSVNNIKLAISLLLLHNFATWYTNTAGFLLHIHRTTWNRHVVHCKLPSRDSSTGITLISRSYCEVK